MKILSRVILAAMATTALAAPLPSPARLFPRAASSAADIILQIAPASNTCSGAEFPDECVTNAHAAPYCISAMSQYGVDTAAEIAALLSVMIYETGEFKFNINHYPGNAGQGTRNMQMPNYNLLYVQSITALKSKLAAITNATSTSGLSDDQLNAIRALVLPDQYSFASAAWFYKTQCSADVKTQLRTGSQAGYENYLTACIGTSASDDRLTYWKKAMAAFGLT